MINVNELKPRTTFIYQQNPYILIEYHHIKQGRGQATIKIKCKNLKTNKNLILTFNSSDKVQKAHIELENMIYLYKDTNNIFLMNQKTFEQIEIDIKKVAWELNFIQENDVIKVKFWNSEIIGIEIDSKISLEVIKAPNAIKGNTQSNPQKKIKVITGFELEAPLFIKKGDLIIVSTIDGKYISKNNV